MSTHRLSAWMIALAICVFMASSAGAAVIVLQDFESYTPGADTAGDVTVVDATFGVGPTSGTQQLLLTSGVGSVTDTAAETAMGMAGGTIQSIFDTRIAALGLSTGSGPTEGSAYQITFSAEAGDIFEFDWTFLTNEFTDSAGNTPANPGLYTDFAWGFLELPSTATNDSVLSHANDPAANFVASASSFLDETATNTLSLTLGATGSYTVTLGVNDVQDTSNNWASALVIDYFRLVRGPEPGTFGTVAGGLVALSWLSRRRRL